MSSTEFFPSAVWQRRLRDSDLDARAKTLGLWMSVYADPKTGEMFPSIASLQLLIVNEDGKPLGATTVKKMRKLLVEEGWLHLVEQGRGRGRASVYRLTFPASKNGRENGREYPSENGRGRDHQVQHEVITPRSLGKWSVEEGKVNPDTTAPLAEAHPPFGSSEQKIAEWYAQQDKATNGNHSPLADSTRVRRCAACDSGEMVYATGPDKGSLVPGTRLHEHGGVLLHDHCTEAAVSATP